MMQANIGEALKFLQGLNDSTKVKEKQLMEDPRAKAQFINHFKRTGITKVPEVRSVDQTGKKKVLKKLIDDETPIEITMYGQRHLKCIPVRLVGNVLNYRLLRSINTVHSVSLVAIHKMEVL